MATDKYIQKLIESTNYKLLPQVLFDNQNKIKSKASLKKLFNENVIMNTFQKLNFRKETPKWTLNENKKMPDDMLWFSNMFGFIPTNVQQIFDFFLLQQEKNLHFFVNSKFKIWSSVEDLISVIRQELK